MTAKNAHPHRALPEQTSFPALEEQVLERWRERDVFAQSLRQREGATPFVFYEGPPTANAGPGSHHVLARVFKDIFPRYKTMRGFYVQRKGGWDCHGLPVEIAVERKLGFTKKSDIEEYGIAKFNQECRESVFGFLEEWDALTERIGYWVDLEQPYRTLDASYIESVWWALGQLWEKELLYEGFKVVAYCPKDGTALSSHEVAQGYQDVVDPSVFVKLRLLDSDEQLLIWTTTPWTLPGNVAVAVGPEIEYARVRHNGETLIVAAGLVGKVFGEGPHELLEPLQGSELIGRRYSGPIFNVADREPGGLPVIAGDFVTTDDGTGIVHIAPAFGEEDFNAAAAASDTTGFDPTDPATLYNPVRRDGTYDSRVRSHDGRSYEGRFVKDPQLTQELIEDLRASGKLFAVREYEHSYPHCWRCGTPLIYYAKPSWYIRTSQARERLMAANETIDWHPEHIKHGRFGKWLENNVDWAISRERYWGTPLPIWRNAAGETRCVGSFAELQELSGVKLDDPHRPYVDEIEIPSLSGGEPLRRVAEVIDVWFDSGAMPFAQYHAPFENRASGASGAANELGASDAAAVGDQPAAEAIAFQDDPGRFPADYICEAIDQTRGWFYSLLAVSTLLFDEAPYKTVLCLGHIADLEGKKMSKSLGNTVAPWDVIERHGADAFRWYYLTSKQPWDGYLFSVETVGESVRQFLLQLWNTYGFYVRYANVNGVRPAAHAPANELDRWVLSRLRATVDEVTERLDAYDATRAGQAIAAFVDELSNWYVRRSRPRFWDGEQAAFATLHTCLLTTAKLLAPFCPFVADEIYDNLDGGMASVHLCDWVAVEELGERDEQLEFAMGVARETVRLGLAARGQAKLKVRQPLRAAVVVADGDERAAIDQLADVVLGELNVKELRYVTQADELGEYDVKPNFRALGPRFGSKMPQLASAVAGLDAAHVVSTLRDGGSVGVFVDGHEHELGADDLVLAMRPLDGYQLEREGSHAVALDLGLDDELVREGMAREIVHAVQSARKSAGLAVEDRIELSLAGEDALLGAAQAHRDYLTGETLAVSLQLAGTAEADGSQGSAGLSNEGHGHPNGGQDHREQAQLDGMALTIVLRRAERS